MIVNLAKIFPKSCQQLGITDLHVNVFDIRVFKRVRKDVIGFGSEAQAEDVVQISNIDIYRFPALDDGIAILGQITNAYNVFNTWNGNRELLEAAGQTANELNSRKDEAVDFIARCVLDYS